MIETDLGLQALLDGPAAQIEWLDAQGVDWRKAIGSYHSVVLLNMCAQQSLARAVVKQILHGDAMVGCEFDGERWHQHDGSGCRLDVSARRRPAPPTPVGPPSSIGGAAC